MNENRRSASDSYSSFLSQMSLLTSSILPSNNLLISSTTTTTTKKNPTKKITSTAQESSRPNSPPLSTNNSKNPFKIPLKIPSPPWMTTPLTLSPDRLLDLSQPNSRSTTNKTQHTAYKSLTGGIRGGRSRQAMKQIVRNIKKLREIDCEAKEVQELDVTRETSELNEMSANVPWVRVEERMVFRREKKERAVTEAEKVLSREELERLREEGKGLKSWVKAKKAGVTQQVVDEVLRRWRKEELVMVKFVDPLRRNMDRAREIVEDNLLVDLFMFADQIKTGGLVVLSKKDTLVVYRGNNQLSTKPFQGSALAVGGESFPSTINSGKYDRIAHWSLQEEPGSIMESLYEREANRLLDGLGPRFIDWWWRTPLPVDADLLPEVVPGFMTPFRLCPPRERPKLRDEELTYLRKLALPLPTHFALGKNTKLQGLAAAIIKLWEKSLIAKIAIKVGIQNTDNEQMAEELKRLTGGILILRNKFFIILYRGKDFLPGKVASSIHERQMELLDQQLKEEEVRAKAIKSFTISESVPGISNIGTFIEFKEIQANYLHLISGSCVEKIKVEAEKEQLVKELKDEEHKLLILMLKIGKSEKELAKLNASLSPSEQSADQELLTEEERQLFKRIGLKMDQFVLLGRRGVYDGTVESIRQHWKHREVVKVITMQRAFQQITYTARLLEIESGGILVAVEKLKSGHAIIIYRGKNYDRMSKPQQQNLLTKREALLRSIEIQRRGSMKYFARQKQRTIWELKQRLRNLERRANKVDAREHQGQT